MTSRGTLAGGEVTICDDIVITGIYMCTSTMQFRERAFIDGTTKVYVPHDCPILFYHY